MFNVKINSDKADRVTTKGTQTEWHVAKSLYIKKHTEGGTQHNEHAT